MRIRPLLFTLSTLFVASPALAAITEVTGFGSNPGALKMFERFDVKHRIDPCTELANDTRQCI